MAVQFKSKPKLSLKLESREDGIYLIVVNPFKDIPVSKAEVLRVVSENMVRNVDLAAVGAVCASDEQQFEMKISADNTLPEIHEDIKLDISQDKMKVLASFTPPRGIGKKLSASDIKSRLSDIGVIFGIKEDIIDLLIENKNYEKTYIVAMGKQPVDDTDGDLMLNFDSSKATYSPKLLADGTADFRNLSLFRLAMKGQVLASVIDSVEGEDGCNVVGAPIVRRKGKKAPPLPRGKNVSPDETGKNLIADLDGQVLLVAGKVNVFPVLEIKDDVGNKTGNIDFNGSVTIKGNVLTGFRLVATGNIDIDGVIEGAYVSSGGNLNCGGGIQGLDKAEIVVAGSVTSKYIHNCSLEAGDDIISNSIMHSKVTGRTKILLTSGKGLIAGGSVSTVEGIECKIIGSTMATTTIVELGASKEIIEEYNALVAEIEKSKLEYKKVDGVLQAMAAGNVGNRLTPEKKMLLAKYENLRDHLYMKMMELKDQVTAMLPKVNNNSGYLAVSDVIHSGVKVTIGNAALIVRDDIHHARLYNDKAKVVIGMY